MKILYCIPSLDHGGAERQASYVAAELVRMGHEVHVASRAGGPNLDRMLAAGVIFHQLSRTRNREPRIFSGLARSFRALLILLRLIRLMRQIKPDVVQTILAPMDMLGGAAALINRTPWVLKECSSSLIYTTYRRYWLRRVFGTLADVIVSNSKHGSDYWSPARRGRQIHVIPNAILIAETTAQTLAANANNLRARPREKVVLYAGRIDIGKNVEALITALARLANDVPYKAIVCGEGSHADRVRLIARDLNIVDRIEFTGYVDDLSQIMQCADVVVSLSRCEGCPNVVLEAMACGLPLVVSDIPAHREILDESMAWFATLDDEQDAARAIKSALTDVAEASNRSSAARAKALARPTLKTTAQLYERAYQRAVEAHKRSRRASGAWIEGTQSEWRLPLNQKEI